MIFFKRFTVDIQLFAKVLFEDQTIVLCVNAMKVRQQVLVALLFRQSKLMGECRFQSPCLQDCV